MNGTTHVELRPGAYADSVTLLQVSRTVQGAPGVAAAQVAMATALNVEVLTQMGFDGPAQATTNDLVVALRLTDDGDLTAALAAVDAAVRSLLPRTTLLSATLLDCALHGEVLPEFAAYLLALGTPDEASRAADLSSIGHTSGAGLLHGARRALAELTSRTAQDPSTLTRGAA